MYESYGWMSKKVDPGFIHHLAIGQLWARHLLLVADSNIIPYDIVKFTKQVKAYLIKFETRYKNLLDSNSVSLGKFIFIFFQYFLTLMFKISNEFVFFAGKFHMHL